MKPEEVELLVGDGNARVTIAFDMSDKDFGSGFGAHVSVSLACDQSSEILCMARDSASAHVAEMMQEAIKEARQLWQDYERDR